MGLLLSYLDSFGLTCFFFEVLLLFYKPMDHYSCYSGLMVFFSIC